MIIYCIKPVGVGLIARVARLSANYFFFEFGIKGPKHVGLGLQPLKHLLALALTPQNIFRAKEYVHLSEKNVEKKNDFG